MGGSAPLRTVFLDRDGVINRGAPPGDYIKSVHELELLDGAAHAIRRLNEAGLQVVVVTNQRGIALGVMTEEDLTAIHHRLRALLAADGARLDLILHCPHAEGRCDCRKPGIGMFLKARQALPGIDFAASAMVGDSFSDMACAERIGARGILVSPEPAGDFECSGSLAGAVRLLLGDGEPTRSS